MTGKLASKRAKKAAVIALDLSTNRLLAALELDVLDDLRPYLQIVPLRRHDILYEPDDRLTHSYFPLDCVISLIAVLRDGSSAEIAVFGRESVVAFMGAMLGGEAFGRYVVQAPGLALKIAVDDLQEVMQRHPSLGRLLRAFLVAFTRQVFQCVACNACHPVEARCCRWVLSMADRCRGDEVPITHELLSEMLGVQRPTVSIIMGGLQSAGLIKQRRGSIKILDRSRLRQSACECYDAIRTNFERWLPKTYGD
ncbi:MAG: Crp/Fnr family transcriptional regulator [Hyphomicrobiales bacterium]|nr:Crp/Fnr family transcriptional regulator [Hyphomicrobiales bacterium]